MIPKVIHYVWVGGEPMGALQRRCINSWRQHLPNYKFRLWDENNLPASVMTHPYFQAMYGKRKWAFVSDYVRFWALRHEGGIYLDTDTEVLKSFDPLLGHEVFFGRTKDGFVAAGVIGAVPEHSVIKAILDVYDQDGKFNTERTSPRIVTEVLDRGLFPDVVIYDYQYFNPCDDGEHCSAAKLALAYTNNHWAESWVPFARVRKLLRRSGIMGFIKRLYVAENR
jgi:hypothetical protein